MASEKSFVLEIITPLKSIFKGDVLSVTPPGEDGFFQILKNHAPILAALKEGEVKVVLDDKSLQSFAISGGFFEVNNNSAILLAESVK